MATIPTSPAFSSITVRRNKITPSTTSPFTGDMQVYEWVGSEKWEFDAVLPAMKDLTDQAAWIAWLVDQEGMYNTFGFDLNGSTQGSLYNYAQGQTSPETWRLREPIVGWTIGLDGSMAGITIKAIEA
jgi:hypothetical protein